MLRLADIMTTDVVTVSPELTLREAMELFAARHISGAPVLEGTRVVGVVSLTDLVALSAAVPGVPSLEEPPTEMAQTEELEPEEGDEPPASYFTDMWDDAGADVVARAEAPAQPEWNMLEERTVNDAMSHAIASLPPGTAVPAAADYMRERGIHRVLVMEGDQLLGIATTTDITNAVADHKLSERRFVFGPPQVTRDRGWW